MGGEIWRSKKDKRKKPKKPKGKNSLEEKNKKHLNLKFLSFIAIEVAFNEWHKMKSLAQKNQANKIHSLLKLLRKKGLLSAKKRNSNIMLWMLTIKEMRQNKKIKKAFWTK